MPSRREFCLLLAVQAPPYIDRRKGNMGYYGPGADEPEPTGLKEVRIGYFGPPDAKHTEGGTFWTGASRAIDEANRAGPYKGLPFRLVAKWSESPWVAGGRAVVEMAYTDRVWAIIGSIDATSTHIAEQVAVKARLALLDPASTDRSVNAAMVPWMFSCLPADPAIAETLCGALSREAGARKPVLLASTGHDERLLAAEFRQRLNLHKQLEFQPGSADLEKLAAEGAETGVAVVVAGIADSVRAVQALRKTRPNVLIYGGPATARNAFRRRAGEAAEEVRCPLLAKPDAESDYADLQTYDAVRLLIECIRQAGLNRVRIRQALADVSPWQGSAGEIRWNGLNRNTRAVKAGVIRGGRIQDTLA